MGDDLYLNVAMTMARSRANGPGERAVIWVQGCTIGCPGCYNAFTHPHEAKRIMALESLAEWINSIDDIEGITFSGGEPFEQAGAIVRVIELVNKGREQPLSVFIFTGYELAALRRSNLMAVSHLLRLTDMLSAGPFMLEERDTNLLWRGSSNQRLEYLSDRYNPRQETDWICDSPVEEIVMSERSAKRTGFAGPSGLLLRALYESVAVGP